MPGPENSNGDHGWESYRRFVVGELQHLSEELNDAKEARAKLETTMTTQFSSLRHDIGVLTSASRNETTSMKVQIAMLQVKSGVWGICGGMGTVAIALLVAWASGKI